MDEGGAELLPEVVAGIKIGLEADRPLRGREGGKHRRKNLIPGADPPVGTRVEPRCHRARLGRTGDICNQGNDGEGGKTRVWLCRDGCATKTLSTSRRMGHEYPDAKV